MSDWIEGTVTRVVDGDTFDLQVEWVGKANSQSGTTTTSGFDSQVVMLPRLVHPAAVPPQTGSVSVSAARMSGAILTPAILTAGWSATSQIVPKRNVA